MISLRVMPAGESGRVPDLGIGGQQKRAPLPSSRQKLLRESGVAPRRRRPASVRSLGSSHERTYLSLTSFCSLRLDRTVLVMFIREYSQTQGL